MKRPVAAAKRRRAEKRSIDSSLRWRLVFWIMRPQHPQSGATQGPVSIRIALVGAAPPSIDIGSRGVRRGERFDNVVMRRELAYRIGRPRVARNEESLAAAAAEILFAPLA